MESPSQPALRILLLEDSDFDTELTQREMARAGLHCEWLVVQARPEFEAAIAEFRPTLILADFKLPTFDGATALAIARRECPDVPVIILSGTVGEETAVELLKQGATDFVLKDRIKRLGPKVGRALREVADRMARRRAEQELRRMNEELELRVAARTRELTEKNALMEEELHGLLTA